MEKRKRKSGRETKRRKRKSMLQICDRESVLQEVQNTI